MGKEKGKQKVLQQLNICTTLNDFRNKGAAWQSQKMADKILVKLKEMLPDDDWWKLKIAHSHYLTGEGADELYNVCKELSEKYNNTLNQSKKALVSFIGAGVSYACT